MHVDTLVIVEPWQLLKLMRAADKPETQERVAVHVSRPSAVEPGRADAADEVQGPSAGEFFCALGRPGFCSTQAFN